MFNYYDKVRSELEIFKQFSCKDILFVKYDCPIEVKKLDAWSHFNYIMYVVTGKKSLHTPNRSWLLTPHTAVFVRKGGFILEKFFDEVFCLIVFFIPDDYLSKFLRENSGYLRKGACLLLQMISCFLWK